MLGMGSESILQTSLVKNYKTIEDLRTNNFKTIEDLRTNNFYKLMIIKKKKLLSLLNGLYLNILIIEITGQNYLAKL